MTVRNLSKSDISIFILNPSICFWLLICVFLIIVPDIHLLNLSVFAVLLTFLTIFYRKNNIIYLKYSTQEYFLLVFLAVIFFWNQCYSISFNSGRSWQIGLHNTIFPLTGKNVEIVPFGAKGYLLDRSVSTKVENGNSYFKINFQNVKVRNSDTLEASVYCFVSDDFNGNSVRLLVEGDVKGNNEASFKLFDKPTNESPTVRNLLYNGDFKLGKLNWIPNADSTTHTLIDTPYGKGIRVERTNGDGGWWSLRYMGRPIIYNVGHRYQIKFKFKIEKGNALPFHIGWWVNEDNNFYPSNLPLELKVLKNGWTEATCSYRFSQTAYDLATFLNSLEDNSIVDITSVELNDLDRIDSIPLFVDQMNNKGTWQKLSLKTSCKSGKVSICFIISKDNVSDFSSLNGYVIFAIPQYGILR
jgi:hypothetical protein